jgi:urea transport system permease protein
MGAVIGAFLIQGAQSYLGDTFLNTWLLVLGAFFILVVRFLPKGLAGLIESVLGRFPLGSKSNDNGDGVAAHRLYPQPGE